MTAGSAVLQLSPGENRIGISNWISQAPGL